MTSFGPLSLWKSSLDIQRRTDAIEFVTFSPFLVDLLYILHGRVLDKDRSMTRLRSLILEVDYVSLCSKRVRAMIDNVVAVPDASR